MTVEKLSRGCVEMVTRNALPFTTMDSSGFRSIVDPMSSALGITINAVKVKQMVKECATKIKFAIANELKGEIFSLKMNSASRFGRSILGINAQLIIEDKVVIRTLAMVEMKCRLTAENIKQMIEDTLRKYNCTLMQVCSVTMDNGSNMIQCGEENQIDSNMNEDDVFDTNIQNTEINNLIKCVQCASHTLQLAVMDAAMEYDNEIKSVRHLVKSLQSGQNSKLLSDRQIEIPTLDDPTRWYSTFLMIQSIMNHREFYQANKAIDVSDELWDFMSEFEKTFCPAFNCTKELQTKEFCVGDFIVSWMKLKMNLSRLDLPMARKIIHYMKVRQPNLTDNIVVKAALFIDPRFNYAELSSPYLSDAAKNDAEEYLLNLFTNMQMLTADPIKVEVEDFQSQPENEEDLELFYNGKIGGTESADVRVPRLQCIKQSISALRSRSLYSDVFQIWRELKNYNPDMYQLASQMLSVPSSQVSVERAFSALELIHTNRQSSLKDENLQNLLLVKFNFNLLDNIS